MCKRLISIKKYDNIIILCSAAFFTLLMYIPLHGAGLWDIDDHEIVFFSMKLLKGDNFFSDFYNLWLQTEVGSFPNTPRFRPVYYFVRILKSALFGVNGNYWFIYQAIIFFSSLLAIGFALRRFFSLFIVIISISIIASLPFNFDMWPRLGPAENEAFLFFMLSCWALSYTGKYQWAWGGACIFAAMAMGYKENFVLLLIPLCAMFFYAYKIAKQKILIYWVIVPLCMGVLISIVLIKIITGSLGHFYVQDVSFGLFKLIPRYLISKPFLASMLLFLPACVALFREKKHILQNDKQYVVNVCTIFCITSFLGFANYIFYHGMVGLYSRYAFPYFFYLIVVPFLLSIHVFTKYYYNIRLFKPSLYLMFFAILSLVIFMQIKLFNHSTKHVESINNFQRFITIGKKYENIIIFNNEQPIIAFEPYYSLQRFSESDLTAPNIYYYPLFFVEPHDALNVELENALKQLVSKQRIASFNPEKTLVAQRQDNQWTMIDFASSTRKIENIPQKSFNKGEVHHNILFVLTSSESITECVLFGNLPDAYTIKVNNRILSHELIARDNNKVRLNFNDIAPKNNLYIISINCSVKDVAQLKLNRIQIN